MVERFVYQGDDEIGHFHSDMCEVSNDDSDLFLCTFDDDHEGSDLCNTRDAESGYRCGFSCIGGIDDNINHRN